MKRFNNLIQDLFDKSITIPSSRVPFRQEVRTLCAQNLCGNFDRSWTCPPAIGSLEELQKKILHFSRVVIVNKVYQLEDSFDWEGMKRDNKDFQSRVVQLQKEIRKTDPDFQFLVLGAGACTICDHCTYKQQLPCRNPSDAIVSVEACGIDVMEMVKENGLSYKNGPNTVTFVGAIFYQ